MPIANEDATFMQEGTDRPFTDLNIFAPRLFFELANNPARLLGVRPSGVLIMRKLCKSADAYIKAE